MLGLRSFAMLSILASSFAVRPLQAQDTGRLEGKVLDASGAIVPKATVTVTSAATAR